MSFCRCNEPVCICAEKSTTTTSKRNTSIRSEREVLYCAIAICSFCILILIFMFVYEDHIYHHRYRDAPYQSDNECMGTCKPGCRPVYGTKSDGSCQLKCECANESPQATKSPNAEDPGAKSSEKPSAAERSKRELGNQPSLPQSSLMSSSQQTSASNQSNYVSNLAKQLDNLSPDKSSKSMMTTYFLNTSQNLTISNKQSA